MTLGRIKNLLLVLVATSSVAFSQQQIQFKTCFNSEGKYDARCSEKMRQAFERMAVRKAFEKAIPFNDTVEINFTAMAGDSLRVENSSSLHSEKLIKSALLYLQQLKSSLQFPESGSISYRWKFTTADYIDPLNAPQLTNSIKAPPLSFSKNKNTRLISLKNDLVLQYRLVHYRIYHVLKKNGIQEIFSGSLHFKQGKAHFVHIELPFSTKSYNDMLSSILAGSFEPLQVESTENAQDFSVTFTYDPFASNLNRWLYIVNFMERNVHQKHTICKSVALLALHEGNAVSRNRCIDSLAEVYHLDHSEDFILFNRQTNLKALTNLEEEESYMHAENAIFAEREAIYVFLVTDYSPVWPGCEESEQHTQELTNCFLQLLKGHFNNSIEFQRAISTLESEQRVYLSIVFSKDGAPEKYHLFSGKPISQPFEKFIAKRIDEMPRVIPARWENDFVRTSVTVPLW